MAPARTVVATVAIDLANTQITDDDVANVLRMLFERMPNMSPVEGGINVHAYAPEADAGELRPGSRQN